jgi:uncharacterized protein DUF5318
MSSRRSTAEASVRRAVEARARSVVDYALARRAALADLSAGRASAHDACDAQAYLLRAARYHGEPAGENCPVCERGSLVHVSYTFGDCFRSDVNGRARAPRELLGLAAEFPDFKVFLVEVCPECRWNHLLAAYVLGTGEQAKRRARP